MRTRGRGIIGPLAMASAQSVMSFSLSKMHPAGRLVLDALPERLELLAVEHGLTGADGDALVRSLRPALRARCWRLSDARSPDHPARASSEGGGTKRVYDRLRHSAATEAEESGVDLDKVRHLTAHKDSTMNREAYVQQSAKITVEIQTKRGLIRTKP